MATIVTRAGKGSPLTNQELDSNFSNLNTDKAELSGATFTGAVTANAGVVVDTITVDGSTIASTGSLGLNIGGNLTIDVDGTTITLADGGANWGQMFNSAQNFVFKNPTSDKDILLQGIDGGVAFTALTLDMSDGGSARFAHDISLVDSGQILLGVGLDGRISSDGTNLNILANNGNLNLDAAGDIILDADGGDIFFKDGGTSFGKVQNSSSSMIIESLAVDKDILFYGNDNSSSVLALTLDMSAAGAATFNAGATFGGNITATAANINGQLNLTGTTNSNNIFAQQLATQFDTSSFMRFHPSSVTNSGGFTNIFFGTSTSNNYGVAIGGKRAGTNDEPTFAIRMLNDSTTGTEVLTIANSGAATFNSDITIGGTAHRVWGSGYNTVQLDTSAMIYGNASSISTASNLYYNSGWKHVATGAIGINVNEAGYHTFYTGPSGSAGAAASFSNRLSINPTGNITINEDGADADFRVESDGNANMLFVDGGNNHVCIGTATDMGGVLNVNGGAVFDDATTFDPDTLGTGRIAIGQINDGGGFIAPGIAWGGSNGQNAAIVSTAGILYLGTGNQASADTVETGIEIKRGEITVNNNSLDTDFRVESNGNANMLFVDGGNNKVIVGSNTGNAPFAVKINSPDGGRLASFGSVSVAGSDVCAGTGGAVSIARSVIVVQPNTVTNLVSGYGGSYIMMVINSPSGVADVQRTVVATHAWSSASILFDNNYGSNGATFTFSVASGVLRISHNHSGALRFGVSCLIVPAPTTGS